MCLLVTVTLARLKPLRVLAQPGAHLGPRFGGPICRLDHQAKLVRLVLRILFERRQRHADQTNSLFGQKQRLKETFDCSTRIRWKDDNRLLERLQRIEQNDDIVRRVEGFADAFMCVAILVR